ncbi:MAG: baseplate J/gp47 family protein [Polaromonas sp.]
MDDTAHDNCPCCEGAAPPAAPRNAPGLPALAYRIDTQPGFNARMLQRLPLWRAEPVALDSPRPLARLLTRSSDDPAVALIDACACLADVLTFYQERIANEGFLRTATERRSVLELARAIGYELKPGVAASTHLAFTVEDAPGAPGVCTLAQGLPVQSVPAQGKLPQVFETSAAIVARAEWNALRPRPSRPADMALLDLPASSDGGLKARKALVLLGPAGSFPPGTPGLHQSLLSSTLARLNPELVVESAVDAIEVSRVYFSEAAAGLAAGDLLLFTAHKDGVLAKQVLRAVAVAAEPALKRLRVDLEPLPDPVAPAPPPLTSGYVPYAIKPMLAFARAQVSTVSFTGKSLATTVKGRVWRERDLQAMMDIQGWNGGDLVKALAAPASGPAVAVATGVFSFDTQVGFFGHNAPKWKILPSTQTNGIAYAFGWDVGDKSDSAGHLLAAPRTVWQDSQGQALGPTHVFLERALPVITRASWLVIDAPEVAAQAYSVFDARESSRADFGLSGRAMALTLADDSGSVLASAPSAPFPFRSSTAHVASRRLDLAALPIDTPVAAGDTAIELDRMVLGLAPGQTVALTGQRDDLPGVAAAEIATLADIVHADGRSTLRLQSGLLYSYQRASLKINANVAHATHGESVNEMLGSGNAAQAHQRFVLKKPPTTFVSAATASGVQNTLTLRVGGVRWDELPSLYGAAPDAPVYTTRLDDDARMQLIFGDGVQGARLPSGTANVTAHYRSGLGRDGEVAAGTLTMLRAMPLGLRDVANPLPASGAQDPERLADARRNAPLTLLTFERVVSRLDYENYARAYPGIGKARSDLLWVNGAALVFLSVAGATGGAPGAEVLAHLKTSISQASDPSQRFAAGAFVPRYFNCGVQVAVDPRHFVADVLAAVAQALQAGFSFDARELGQSVTAAEVLTLIQGVAGVVAADLFELQLSSDAAASAAPAASVANAVPAFGARWHAATRRAIPAELLLLNPAALLVKETPA